MTRILRRLMRLQGKLFLGGRESHSGQWNKGALLVDWQGSGAGAASESDEIEASMHRRGGKVAMGY